MLIDDAVTEVLDRLADSENQIWSRDEIKAYYQDGLDQFCRRSKCLWDIHVIENLPPVGNWQTDLEKYIADHTPGLSTTDERMVFTADDEKSKPLGGGAHAGHRGPIQAVITKPSDRTYLSDYSNLTVDAGKKVVGGTLPTSTVEVSRVSYDQRTLAGVSSQRMRELDPRYETRAGEPNYYVFDKDGLYFLRVVPAAQAGASYDTVSGSWGTCTYRGTRQWEYVEWETLIKAESNGTDIYPDSTASNNAYDSGGLSSNYIRSGDGWVECTVTENGPYAFGMDSTGDYTVTQPYNCDYAWYMDATDRVRPAVNASLKSSSTYIGGDYPVVLRIEIDSDASKVYFKIDGTTYYTATSQNVTYPLRFVCSTYRNPELGLTECKISESGATESQEDTIADTGTGGYGILRYRSDCFPAGGPNGTPTRIHPDTNNIRVEMFRLNRDTTSNEIELPTAYQKYPMFWAMHKALERTGSGQAMKLSDHYKQRFELGVQRMEEKVREMDKERIGRLGGMTQQENFALGSPQAPYPYGRPY